MTEYQSRGTQTSHVHGARWVYEDTTPNWRSPSLRRFYDVVSRCNRRADLRRASEVLEARERDLGVDRRGAVVAGRSANPVWLAVVHRLALDGDGTVGGMGAWDPPIESVETRREAVIYLCVLAAEAVATAAVVVALLGDSNTIALLMLPVLFCNGIYFRYLAARDVKRPARGDYLGGFNFGLKIASYGFGGLVRHSIALLRS